MVALVARPRPPGGPCRASDLGAGRLPALKGRLTGMVEEMEWYRVYHGAAFDPAVRAAALKAKIPTAHALAVWLALADCASQAEDRGSLDAFNPEVVALVLEIPAAEVVRALAEFSGLGVIDPQNRLILWLKQQSIKPNGPSNKGAGSINGVETADELGYSRERSDRGDRENKKGTAKRSPGDGDDDATDECTAAVAAWNALASDLGLSVVQRLGKARKASVRARLGECGGIEGWAGVLEKVRGSRFLRGEGGNGWKATFDFVITASKFTRLMEGAYDDNPRADHRAAGYEDRSRTVREGVAGALGLGADRAGRMGDDPQD